MLLISVLLGNMVVNVLYFVLSAVLIMQLGEEHIHPLFLVALPPVQLVAIILLGEVLPKLVANHDRTRWITFTAVPLHAMHRVIGPVRIAANSLVIEPLVRLTAPSEHARSLDAAELGDLLRLSAKQGVIDDHEERLLGEVVRMSARKVRDVMVPRTEIEALPNTATREDVISLVERTRFTKIPIYDQTIDHVLGILRVKNYLACDDDPASSIGDLIEPILFVPEVATIESLIDYLRKSGASIAIAVDEFGGTAGLVALEHAIGPLITDRGAGDGLAEAGPAVEPIGDAAWRVSGRLRIRDWLDVLGRDAAPPDVTTVGGLIVSRLGRMPAPGDCVRIGNVQLRVEQTDGVRIISAVVQVIGADQSSEQGGGA